MRPPRTSARRRAAAVVLLAGYALLIFGGSSAPAPPVITSLEVPDFVLHFLEYAVLGLLASRCVLHLRLDTGLVALVVVPALLCGLYGATDEVHQMFVPARDPSLRDVAADLAGGLAGALSYRVWLLRHLSRGEGATGSPGDGEPGVRPR